MAEQTSKFLQLNNGTQMPALGIGTWRAPDQEIETALESALEAGYRHIDCAPVYQNEPAIGRVLRRWLDAGRVQRADLYIVTKLPPTGNRAASVETCLRASLRDLQLDYVDMYLIHTPFAVPETGGGDFKRNANGDVVLDADTDHVATWRKLEQMVGLGLCRSIGVSNFNRAQLERLLAAATIKPANLQIECHIYLQQHELVDVCRANGVVVTAYSPLGSKGIEALNKMAGIQRTIPDLLENPAVLTIAQRLGRTPAQILLKWLLERGVAAIPKSTNPGRLRQNLDVFGFALTADDQRVLRGLDEGIRVCDFGFFKGIEKHPEFPW